jgi:tRNA (guanine37-N1)-methyltransferase
MAVPEVLVNGNHDQIRRWRRRTALAKTLRNRPDLIERVALTEEDKELLREIRKQFSVLSSQWSEKSANTEN